VCSRRAKQVRGAAPCAVRDCVVASSHAAAPAGERMHSVGGEAAACRRLACVTRSAPDPHKASFVSLGMGRIQGVPALGFQSSYTAKLPFVSARLRKKNIAVSFPAQPTRSDAIPVSTPPDRTLATATAARSRGGGATLAAREARKRRREVEAWRREVEGWRRESTPASSSRTTSWNSVAAFSPVSAFRPPALSFFPLSSGRRVSRAQARAAGVMDRARPSWFRSCRGSCWCRRPSWSRQSRIAPGPVARAAGAVGMARPLRQWRLRSCAAFLVPSPRIEWFNNA
jgi:hypothetical protein